MGVLKTKVAGAYVAVARGPRGVQGPAGPSGPAGGPPIGSVFMWMTDTLPDTDHLFLRGQLVSTTTYATLFARWGHQFNGNVDPGGGQFRLPDMQVRIPIGAGTGKPIGETDAVAEASRDANHSHSHGHSASSTSVNSTDLLASGQLTGTEPAHAHNIVMHNGHTHSLSISDPGMPSANNTTSGGTATRLTGGQNHVHAGSTANNGGDHDHGGGTGNGGNHDHTIPQVSTIGHNHGIGTSVFGNGSPEHPYMVVNYIVKAL